MKKSLLSFVLIITTLLSTLTHVFADETNPSVEYTEDGYTIVTYDDGSVLTISPVNITESSKNSRATSKTVTGNKVASVSDSSGNLEWEYTLTATFSYVEGVSSSCTNTYYTQNIYGSGWSFSNGSATASGNTAIGKGTFVEKFLFITIKTYNVDISITCDTYGNLT